MAFFDDNNELNSGAGNDPLEDLDRELDELKLTLGELDADGLIDGPQDEPAQAEPLAAEIPAEPEPAVTARPQPAYTAYEPSPAPKKPKTLIIVLALTVAVVGIAAGAVYWLLTRPIADIVPEPTQAETVTVNDPLLGEVEIEPVEGASVNDYEADKLEMDENGLYSYYVDGRKVSETGVDLSEYQGDVDFEAVKSAGVDFVMLRVGGRYYSEDGGMYSDSAFADYYDQAKAAGLKVGAYFFSQAASVEDAREEAAYALELIGGRKLDYPVAFDWETIEDDQARTDSVTGEILTEIAKAFCDAISDGGYKPIVYASTSLMLQSYDFETMKDYDFWLADYREFPEKEKMYYRFEMWQYSTQGSIDGISGSADLNICFDPY